MPIRAVDVSSYQGNVNCEALYRDGVRQIFIKATEGAGQYYNPWFGPVWNAAAKALLDRSAYHFTHLDQSPTVQMDYFHNTVKAKNLRAIDGLFALDVEETSIGHATPREAVYTLQAMLEHLTGPLGERSAYIYTDHNTWVNLLGNPKAKFFAQFPLWLASYGSAPGAIPGPWGHYTWWQHTDSANEPGLGPLDESYFYGTQHQLDALRRVHTVTPQAHPVSKVRKALRTVHPGHITAKPKRRVAHHPTRKGVK